jgi:hypothetical protein
MVRTEVRQRVAVDRTLDGATDGPTKLKSSRVLDGPRSFPPARRIRGSASPDPTPPTTGIGVGAGGAKSGWWAGSWVQVQDGELGFRNRLGDKCDGPRTWVRKPK